MKITPSAIAMLTLVIGLSPTTSQASSFQQNATLNISRGISVESESPNKKLSGSGITLYQVYAVGSPDADGWETVAAAQEKTRRDHGGAFVNVAVIQYGYGNYNRATINGIAGKHYRRQNLCGSLPNLHKCRAGDTIMGYLDYFTFNGPQSGAYSSSAHSVAAPFGHWKASVYIR